MKRIIVYVQIGINLKFHIYKRPDLIEIVLQATKMYDIEPNPKNRLISYRGLTLLNQIIKALSSSRISRKINIVRIISII